MKVQNHLDVNFLKAQIGTIVEYPDNSKAEVIFKITEKVRNYTITNSIYKYYYLTQIQTNNIKKNGELGKLTSWLRFKHYTI